MRHTFTTYSSVVLGLAVFTAVFAVTGFGPGQATAAAPAKEQAYEANFECTIPPSSTSCAVTVDKPIPAGKRLRIESIDARIVAPRPGRGATGPAIDFYVEFGDPSAAGGVGSIHVVPKPAGRTEGGFYVIYEVSEKTQTFAYRTGNYPAPKVHLDSSTPDSLKLQNGTIQDGKLGGFLEAAK